MSRIVLLSAGALALAACVLPSYKVSDGGASGGNGGRATGGGGPGGSTGVAGATGIAGTTGVAGIVGPAGSGGGGTTGLAGSPIGRGGASGGAGTPGPGGGGTLGRGGSAVAGSPGPGSGGRGGLGGSAVAGSPGPGTGGLGGGPAGGRGGAAGAAGSGATTPPPAWTSQLTAVWLFEQTGQNLGYEANGRAPFLLTGYFYETGTTPPSQDTVHKTQGQGSAGFPTSVSNPQMYMATSGFPTDVAVADSFTTGGWVRPQAIASTVESWIIQDVGDGVYTGGFDLRVDEVGSFYQDKMRALCRAGDAETNYIDAVTPAEVGPDPRVPEWVHVVCRYDNVTQTVAVFVAGVSKAQQNGNIHVGNAKGPLMLGCNEGQSCDFHGNLDELFFAGRALTDGQILRLYACGIDGARCGCQAGNPTAYASCGLLSSCTALPPCNQVLPGS